MTSGARSTLALGLFVVGCQAVGGVGAVLTATSVSTWYAGVRTPAWTPPNAAFGPVWTALYVAIAVAGWLVWRSPRGRGRTRALALWAVQLGLNLAWSLVFFALRSPGYALAEIALLEVCIVGFIVVAWRASRPAAGLFVPYATWVAFAAALNAAIWWLNR